jgi:hypothetical protein
MLSVYVDDEQLDELIKKVGNIKSAQFGAVWLADPFGFAAKLDKEKMAQDDRHN